MGRSKRYKKHGKRRTLKRVRHVGGNQIYISGEAFKNLCKYNLDDRYKIKGIDSTLEENDSVFLKQGDIKSFIKSKPSKKVRLIVHNTDETFDDNLMNTVKPYVSKVYAVNSSAKDAIQLPLGFRDDQYTPHNVLDKVKGLGESVRDILCLLNFSIGKGNNERSDARDSFIGKKWCVIDTNDNPGLHLDHKNNETVRLREEFYTKLTKTKFVICPFGAGKDTHRVYEALFFGAIPVIKTSFLDEMYKKLGECWIVNDWSEVTEDECNRRWNAGGFKPFKSNVSEWLSMSGGSSRPVKIAFYSNHLGERGTEVAMYDYAMFNESLLNNKSIIIYNKNNEHNNKKVIEKFENKFSIFGISSNLNINDIDEILEKEKCDIIYMIISGEKIDIPTKAKVCIHCVFNCIDIPFGDVYASIAPWVNGNNGRYPHVPHMINLPNHNDNMRNELNIPRDAIVYGRYGGFNQFNIEYVHKIVYNVAKSNSNIYFLFANTNKFCDNLPNIIHLDAIIDLEGKVKFINTCDAMLWARSDGEIFSCSMGEFSVKNKPIICTKVGELGHEKLLKDRAIWYDQNNLEGILTNFNKEENRQKDWNAYKDYTPEKVMKIFKEVFIDSKSIMKG
jgi:hypothetical protein